VSDVPKHVNELVEDRSRARAARDYAAADVLRARIREAGYDVEDSPSGTVVRPLSPASSRISPSAVEPVLDHEPSFDVSVQWLIQGWPEAFRRHVHHGSVQYVVVDTAPDESFEWPDGVEVVALDLDPGWGAGRNAGLKRAAGRVVIVVDSSVEPTGDVVAPVLRALEDPTVGVVGPVGAVTDDLREFHPSDGPEVDAVEGYLMAFRRDVVVEAGLFDEGFRFYRAADLDLSFRVRDLGLRAVRVPLPIELHEHRMWARTPEPERARLSKRNYYRFLARWRGRLDLCGGST
jgi:Glycosyl transferase family 2